MNQEMEEKKEYMRGYEREIRRSKRSEERIKDLRCKRMGVVINLDGVPHTHRSSDLSSYAAALDSEERDYLDIILHSREKCKEIANAIENLENEDEKDVLTNRYINLMQWEEICIKMRKSWRQIHRIHSRGLKNIRIGMDTEIESDI